MNAINKTKTNGKTQKTYFIVRSFCQNYTAQEAREMARTKTNVSDVFDFNSDDLIKTKTFDTLGDAIAAFSPIMDYGFDSASESEYFSAWADTVEERTLTIKNGKVIRDEFQEICEMTRFGTLAYDKYGQIIVF